MPQQSIDSVLKEFYETQAEFHEHMRGFVDLFLDEQGNLKNIATFLAENKRKFTAKKRRQFKKFLVPYRTLAVNPFKERPADNQEAINNILTVLQTNQTFLNAMQQCVVQYDAFREFATKIKFSISLPTSNGVLATIDSIAIKPVQRIAKFGLFAKSLGNTELITLADETTAKINNMVGQAPDKKPLLKKMLNLPNSIIKQAKHIMDKQNQPIEKISKEKNIEDVLDVLEKMTLLLKTMDEQLDDMLVILDAQPKRQPKDTSDQTDEPENERRHYARQQP